MKRIVAIVVLIGLLITGCQPSVTETHTPIPVKDLSILQREQEAPDDIMPAPGMGPAYRANIHQQGVDNPWAAYGFLYIFNRIGCYPGSGGARCGYSPVC